MIQAKTEQAMLDSLAKKVRRLRKKLGLTYEQLALKSNISKRTVVNVESGKVHCSTYTLKHIADVFGICPGELLR